MVPLCINLPKTSEMGVWTPLLITLPSPHHVPLHQGSGAGGVDLLAVQAGDQQVDEQGFPGGVSKNLPDNAGDTRDADSIPGSGRSPGEGYGNPLQHHHLDSPMDRGAWWATVRGVAKSQTRLSD